MTESIVYMSATEILAAYSSGDLTPRRVITELLERIEQFEPVVNGTTGEQMPIEAAIAESEKRWREGNPRLLEGVPVVFKEEQPIAGHTATDGTPLFADRIAEHTHPIIERIMDAGAIPIARTTTPEFCMASYTRGALWGITRNPWNPDFAAGGSSGGSGVALASGYSPLATGSDIGGSIRIPASFNGVVGYKPPYGRNPALPVSNLDTYCTDGPMARTVADVALLQNVIAGTHPHDPVSLPNPPKLSPNPDLTGKRVAVATILGDFGIQDDVRDAIAQTKKWLVEAGADVEEIEVPFDRKRIGEASFAHFGNIFAQWVKEEVGLDRIDQLEPYTQRAILNAENSKDEVGTVGGLEREAEVHAVLSEIFLKFDALVCPTGGIPAFLADEYYMEGITVNGVYSERFGGAMMTVPFNIANRNPVLCVPVGRSSDDVPIGAQIVGRPYDDATVFHVGAAIESGRGEWYREDGNRPTFRRGH